MYNIHERRSWKFFWTLRSFLWMVITKRNFPTYENSKNFHHLLKILQELLIYKLLSESSFNLFCLLVSLACELTSKSLKIAIIEMMKSLKLLFLWHISAAFAAQFASQIRCVPVSKVYFNILVCNKLCYWLQKAWN